MGKGYFDDNVVIGGGNMNSGWGAGVGGFIGAVAGDLFRNNRGCNDGGCDGNGATLTYEMGLQAGENGKYRDIAASENAINNNIDSAETNILGAINFSDSNVVDKVTSGTATVLDSVNRNASAILASTNGIENLIQVADRNNVILFKDLDNKLCNMTASLTATNVAGTQKILDKICETNEKNLESKLNEVQRERDLLATGNFPVVQVGAVIRQNPCESNHANEQINIINQNVNAIGSTVNQLAGIVASFQPMLAKLA